MHVLDWIILGSLTLSMLLCAWRGLVYEVFEAEFVKRLKS